VWLDHIRLADHGDEQALARLVREYDCYAVSIARRFYRERESLEDLEQVAREGLVRALRRFDPDRGVPFPAYATPTIAGGIRRHFRDRGWLVRVPRSAHEVAMASNAVTERLVVELGRQPSIEELAAAIDVRTKDVVAARKAIHARDVTSLDVVPTEAGGSVGDRIGCDDPRLAQLDNHLILMNALRTVNPAGQALLVMYFIEGLTQSQIADRLGVSQMQVSRRLGKVLGDLRARLGAS